MKLDTRGLEAMYSWGEVMSLGSVGPVGPSTDSNYARFGSGGFKRAVACFGQEVLSTLGLFLSDGVFQQYFKSPSDNLVSNT